MKIVYEDDKIIVVHKEAGEAVQTASARQQDLVTMLKKHLVRSSGVKGDPYVGVVHRLDQPVEGLLVFAKDKASAAFLSSQLNKDLMNKIYTATVEGVFDGVGDFPSGERILVDYMYKDSAENRAVVVCGEKNHNSVNNQKLQRAELAYKIVGEDRDKNETYLRIHLKTGRFHQIRAQLSASGHPIVRDVKYGAAPSDDRREKGIGLCACELEFIHPVTKKPTRIIIDEES